MKIHRLYQTCYRYVLVSSFFFMKVHLGIRAMWTKKIEKYLLIVWVFANISKHYSRILIRYLVDLTLIKIPKKKILLWYEQQQQKLYYILNKYTNKDYTDLNATAFLSICVPVFVIEVFSCLQYFRWVKVDTNNQNIVSS